MRRRHFVSCIAVGTLLAGLTAMAGCGGGGGNPVVPADVPIQANVTVAANQITSITVGTTTAGDSIDVSNATARVERADGSNAAVTLNSNPDGTVVTAGVATVTPATDQFNTLVIVGPIRFTTGTTGTTCVIGRLEFRFEVLADGTVIRPTSIRANIPTRGAAIDRRITFTGLSFNPRDYTRTIILDKNGGRTESSIHGADAQGRATLQDAQGNVTAEVLSGNASRITILFARTDADVNGVPDLFE
ncbi:MAG: hypothetical protein FJX75_13260 [Armatimonadetes bacterium]|nr:hypothetical protein [Armatimonadota bacterium]